MNKKMADRKAEIEEETKKLTQEKK